MSFRTTVATRARQYADKPFLRHQRTAYTYGDALDIAAEFSDKLGTFRHIAIISNSGDISYLAIFSAVISGATFMHLNVDWHNQRISDVLHKATPDVILCHDEWLEKHAEMIIAQGYKAAPKPAGEIGFFAALTVYIKSGETPDMISAYKQNKQVDDLLYIMFTSGSTGSPKGVPISAASAAHYASSMIETFSITLHERWLQPADLHFDLSMLTVLTAWATSGEIIAIPAAQSPFGPRFVRSFKIHNWTSVPSVIARSSALGLLGKDTMPNLKRSFFCGEALPSDLATEWAEVAPQAALYNLYGPTEATVSLTWHKFDRNQTHPPVVDIGRPMAGSLLRLADDGEIELGGPQVFHGYLGSTQDISTYLTIDADNTRWYKTGDIGALSAQNVLQFKGRKDWQVKVRGNRVEIEGIEAAIRKATSTKLAVVTPLNEVAQSSYDSLCAFVEKDIDTVALKAELAKTLPEYMVPQHIITLADFPKNSNGKIDRNALVDIAKQATKHNSV